MSHIELASEVGDDFERILDHLVQYQVESPALRIREIIEAINVLEYNPMIGRPANNNNLKLLLDLKVLPRAIFYPSFVSRLVFPT